MRRCEATLTRTQSTRSSGSHAHPYRILYYYGSQQFDTGSPKALVSLIDLLDRSVFEPVFVATGEGPLVDELRKRNVEIVNGQVSCISLRSPVRAVRQVSYWAKRLRDLKVDLLHVNAFGSDLDIVLGAWRRGVPTILHLHNPEPIGFRNLHRFAATRVLVVSDTQKLEVQGYERIKHKTDVLHNPIDLDLFHPSTADRKQRSEKTVVATVAQISHRKGIDIVIDAARQLLPRYEHLVFWIIGRAGVGEEDYARRMAEAAADSSLGGRVSFLGARSDVAALLREADVFFLPTRSEPFGIAVTEAMATGLPVVATRTGGIREILSSPEYGIGVPEGSSASAYAEALEHILDLPDLGRAMGARARASLIGRFDGSTIGAKLGRIYQQLLRRDPA